MARDLDGNVAARARVVCAVHLAHAAFADQRNDLVRTELIASRQRHRVAKLFYSLRRLKSWETRNPETGMAERGTLETWSSGVSEGCVFTTASGRHKLSLESVDCGTGTSAPFRHTT